VQSRRECITSAGLAGLPVINKEKGEALSPSASPFHPVCAA
jgi:hypothetical protein